VTYCITAFLMSLPFKHPNRSDISLKTSPFPLQDKAIAYKMPLLGFSTTSQTRSIQQSRTHLPTPKFQSAQEWLNIFGIYGKDIFPKEDKNKNKDKNIELLLFRPC